MSGDQGAEGLTGELVPTSPEGSESTAEASEVSENESSTPEKEEAKPDNEIELDRKVNEQGIDTTAKNVGKTKTSLIKTSDGNASLEKFGKALAEAATQLGMLLRSTISPSVKSESNNRDLVGSGSEEVEEEESEESEDSGTVSEPDSRKPVNDGADTENEDETSKLL